MSVKDAWAEISAKFPWVIEEKSEPIYFWEPGPDTPVAPNHAASNHDAGWNWTTFAEDIPLAYLVAKTVDAIGQIVVYAKWSRQGWEANPQTRHLINHLIGHVNEVKL